jgi:PIN domain nuclease of toxin-antitoxin system
LNASLLDTHFVLALLDPELTADEEWASADLSVSVASLWEIAIKVRLGKLRLGFPLEDLEDRIDRLGCTIRPIIGRHAIAEVIPQPSTNDPFDRLLLAVCQVEDLRLVTRDRKLVDHPLAWKPAAG